MQYSCVQIVAFVVLLFGTGLIIVALTTDHWSYHIYNFGGGVFDAFKYEGGHRGLWRQCYHPLPTSMVKEVCVSRFEELRNTLEKGDLDQVRSLYSSWELICLVLVASSAGLSVLLLLLSPCCCHRCACCLSTIVLLAGLMSAAGVCAYLYYHLTGNSASKPTLDNLSTIKIDPKEFGYSFWCGVGASACQIFASILFAVGRGRSHEYSRAV